MSCTVAAILAAYLDYKAFGLSCTSSSILELALAQKMFLAAVSSRTPAEFYNSLALQNVPEVGSVTPFQLSDVKLVLLSSRFTGRSEDEDEDGNGEVPLPEGFIYSR